MSLPQAVVFATLAHCVHAGAPAAVVFVFASPVAIPLVFPFRAAVG